MEIIDFIKAARSLLDWSQDDLALASGVNKHTIVRIENKSVRPEVSTVNKLRDALIRAGIEFTGDGIRKPDKRLVPLDHQDWFLDVLRDVLLSCDAGDELLIFGGNNRVTISRPEVMEAFRSIRAKGIGMREMVEEGNLYLMGDESEYRWIPHELFNNFVTVIYADKVCVDFGASGALLNVAPWAQAERAKFELMWTNGLKVKGKSNADIRY